MSNLFAAGAAKLRQNPMIVFIWLLFLGMLLLGISLWYTDYLTNVAGYQMLPIRAITDWEVYLIALIPQVGQFGFGYAYAADTKQRWMLFTAIGLHFVDLASCVVYMSLGPGLGEVLLAIFMAELVYGIGSQLLVMVGLGLTLQLLPDAWDQIQSWLWPQGVTP